jgi:uncharacterized protein YndB with AHSA1/START domain
MASDAEPKTRSIIVEYEFTHPPEKVWRALTEAQLIEGWLMPNDFRPVVGHRFTFRTTPVGEWDGICHCEVLLVEPFRRLSYTWRGGSVRRTGYGALLDTVVTWTLSRSPHGGTVLRLEHAGFTPEQESTFTILKNGWSEKMRTSIASIIDKLG